ncbi:MAG: hypothetical protein WBD62_13660, partial [Anaerolineales bacterium]
TRRELSNRAAFPPVGAFSLLILRPPTQSRYGNSNEPQSPFPDNIFQNRFKEHGLLHPFLNM